MIGTNVCSFLRMPRCQCQIAEKKGQCLGRDFGSILTQFQVVCNSKSKLSVIVIHVPVFVDAVSN